MILLHKTKPDFLITNTELQVETNYELIKRGREENASSSVAALTANDREEDLPGFKPLQ